MKDVDSRMFTRMLQKDGRKRYYIPLQLRWREDKKLILLELSPLLQAKWHQLHARATKSRKNFNIIFKQIVDTGIYMYLNLVKNQNRFIEKGNSQVVT